MSQFDFDLFYERNLPHYQPPEATIFITFRLAGSLPEEIIARLFDEARRKIANIKTQPGDAEKSEKLHTIQKVMFSRWDSELDKRRHEPLWLESPENAEIVANCLHSLDGKQYILDAFCIMPNHVHLVCTPLMVGETYTSIPWFMQKIKGTTARQINIELGRQGQVWQHESYDHVVRNDRELERIGNYVLNNPVRAGLAPEWTYSRFELE